MRVYTIQPESLLGKLSINKKIKCDNRLILSKNFKQPYLWKINQAKKFCLQWEGQNPFWVWLEKPDLRKSRYFFDDRKPNSLDMVLLELEIPQTSILISDFSLWHFVLNQTYLPFDEQDDLEFDKLSNNKHYSQLNKKLKAKVESSWLRCLKLNENSLTKFNSDYLDSPQILQGIIPYLEQKQIISIKKFKMLNKSKI